MEVDKITFASIQTYISGFERTCNGFGTCYTSINNDGTYNTDEQGPRNGYLR